jgi:hypothetical protein
VAPVSIDRFATLLRGLEQSRFTAFVAALWDARSDENVTIEQRYIYVGDSDETKDNSQTVLAVIGHSWVPNRFRRLTVPDTVDILITTRQTKQYIESTDEINARLVGPAELRSIALYAIPRPTAETLFTQYFDTSISIDDSHADEPDTHHSESDTGYGLSRNLISLMGGTHLSRQRPVTAVFVVILILTVISGSGIALGVVPGAASNVSPEFTSGDATVGTVINELSVDVQVFLGISQASVEQQSWSQSDAGSRSRSQSQSQIASNDSQTAETTNETQRLLGYPPGVTTTGIVDPNRLAAAHADTVSGQSYRYSVQKQHVSAFGVQTWRELSEEAVVANQIEYLYTATGTLQSTNETEDVNLSVYADGSAAYIRVDRESEENVSFGRFSVSGGEFGSNNGRFANRAESVLQRYLDTSESRIVLSKLTDETYTIVATGQPFGINTDGRINNYQAVAQVNEQGFVSSFTVSYRRVTENKTTTVSVSFEYEDIGSTTPSQPQWYTTAQNQTARSVRE